MFVADYARIALRLESLPDGKWRMIFPAGSELAIEFCERPENRLQIQEALCKVLNHSAQLLMVQSNEPAPVTQTNAVYKPTISQSQLIRTFSEHPFIHAIRQELGGEIVRVDMPQSSVRPPSAPRMETVSAAPQ